MPRPRVLIFTDADNTLWNTDAVYADAQLKLLTNVEKITGIKGPDTNRIDFVREFDQEIAAKHHKGLRYPPELLAHGVALGLRGDDSHTAARVAQHMDASKIGLTQEEARKFALDFSQALHIRPKLRHGVKRGLRRLSQEGHAIIVITEGAKAKCRELLEWYGLDSLVERVIESPKHPDLYRRVCKLGGGADVSVMIGDQLDRDILPAQQAGLTTIYFPGGFRPKWEPKNTAAVADYHIESFDGAVDIIRILIEAQHAGTINRNATAMVQE